MKRATLILGFLLLILAGAFMWLLSASSDANAPTEVTTIDLPDTYEK